MATGFSTGSGRGDMPVRLFAAAAVSLMLHAAVIVSVTSRLGLWSDRTDRAEQSVRPEPTPAETRLGIQRSEAVSLSWLGFAEATPHSAPESDSDQSVVSPEPGGPGAPAPPMPTRSASATPEPAPSRSPTQQGRPSQGEPLPGAAGFRQALPFEEAPLDPPLVRAPSGLRPDAAAQPPRSTDAAAGEREQPNTPPQPARPARPTQRTEGAQADQPVVAPPAAPASESMPAEKPGAEDRPAIEDEREADAVAVEPADLDQLGKTLAAEGMRIITTRPRFGTLTRLTGRARDALVEITFDPSGAVSRAAYAVEAGQRRDAGSRNVSETLLNAIYNWRAEGERIEALAEGETLTITMPIRFR